MPILRPQQAEAGGLSEAAVRELLEQATAPYDELPTLERVREEIDTRAKGAKGAIYTNSQPVTLDPYTNVEIPLRALADPHGLLSNGRFKHPEPAPFPGSDLPPVVALFTVVTAAGANVSESLLRLSVARYLPMQEPSTFYLDAKTVSGRDARSLSGAYALEASDQIAVRLRCDYQRYLIYSERLTLSVVIL